MLDKAVDILGALELRPRSLAELAEVTGLPRATAHRLAVALEHHGLVGRDGRGRFALGDRLAVLGRAASGGTRTLADVAAVALGRLRDRTGESVQLYVPDGAERVCLVAMDSPHSLRTIVAVGARLPMDRGSAGTVLAGHPSALRKGWAQSVEERERGVASVSAPVRVDGVVIAAVSVSGPIERTTRSPGRRYAEATVAAARELEAALAEG